MANKRFGPADAKGTKAVDVNMDAIREKGYKSLEELTAEPGKIFGHLSAAQQKAAYEELAKELGLPATTPAPAAAAPKAAAVANPS